MEFHLLVSMTPSLRFAPYCSMLMCIIEKSSSHTEFVPCLTARQEDFQCLCLKGPRGFIPQRGIYYNLLFIRVWLVAALSFEVWMLEVVFVQEYVHI